MAVDALTDVRAFLAEDAVWQDTTTHALLPESLCCTAEILVKRPGVLAGLAAVQMVFHALDPELSFEALAADGDRIEQVPACVARVEGSARAVLAAERTALNLLGRLSGVATLTRAFVEAVEGTGVAVRDTRKTTPGLRMLEKAAVTCGGGVNHRLSLADGILVKENHLRLAGGITAAVATLRAAGPGLPIEVEAETLAEVEQALAAGAEEILLDNMGADAVREAVRLVDGRARLEASGGVTLDNVRELARTGVDSVAIGALTHSAPALDVSLEVVL